MSDKNLDYASFSSFDESVFPMVSYDVETIFSLDFTNTSDFFSPLTLLDAEENELFGDTGKELLGYRLSAVDMPDGVDRDTAFSIRSDHIADLSIQSGYSSTSDALLCMGTWDSTVEKWGVSGALRVDMSASNSFSMESNYGAFIFNNIGPADDSTAAISPQPAAILQDVNALVLKNRPGGRLPTETAEGAGFYAASGVPYAFDSSGNSYDLTHEVGEWTPTIEQPDDGGFNATYVIQRGDYVKIGSLVQATCFIRLSGSDSGGSGTVSILGLPFADNEDDYQQVGVIGYNDVFANSCTRAWVNGSKMTIIDGAGTPITPTQSNYSGTVGAGDFTLTVTYTTDS